MPHAFFASYATVDNKTRWLEKVVVEMREALRSKLGAANAELVGFFAVYDGIRTAQDWEQKLGKAAREARAIVLFCSNTYFNSEYCPKEFEIFRKRLDAAGSAIDAIVPVIWDACSLPKAVSRYQTSHGAAFPRDYVQQGLMALRRNKTAKPRYDQTMRALVDTIHHVVTQQKPLPPLEPPVAFDELPDAFDNPGAYNVRVGGLHAQGLRWQLVPELGHTVVRSVEAVTSSQRAPWRVLRIDEQIQSRLDEAEKAREAVILIADADALADPRYSALGKLIDDTELTNGVVIVGLRDENGEAPSPSTAQASLRTLFPKLASAGKTRWFWRERPESLEKVLAENIVILRLSLMSSDDALSVSDAALAEAALSEGISIDTRPVVNGPGGP